MFTQCSQRAAGRRHCCSRGMTPRRSAVPSVFSLVICIAFDESGVVDCEGPVTICGADASLASCNRLAAGFSLRYIKV
jgi:hypothetical protein